MCDSPTVSVVMGTHNDAAVLGASIDSVLGQDFGDFEFVIVNDGSPDPGTAVVLADYARLDARVRVITKANEGLTKALIDGCAVARGEYIARIDVGDRYLPGRLTQQLQFLSGHPEVALLSCGTRYLTEAGDYLYECAFHENPQEATRLLRADSPAVLRGVTHHGATMFRRLDYERVGGYRWQLYFAQDMDLWMRLTDRGLLAFLPDVRYEATFSPAGISGRYAREQVRLSELIVAMRRRRDAGLGEDDLLAQAAAIRPALAGEPAWVRRVRLARGEYFVAQMLRRNGNGRCLTHYARALRHWPLHWRALLRAIQARAAR